ncbi:hypothetical protein [Marinicellulosiphila megalodicopiae]
MNTGRTLSDASNYNLLDTVSAALGVQDQVKSFASGIVSGLLKL